MDHSYDPGLPHVGYVSDYVLPPDHGVHLREAEDRCGGRVGRSRAGRGRGHVPYRGRPGHHDGGSLNVRTCITQVAPGPACGEGRN
jgi:hypothetical protein